MTLPPSLSFGLGFALLLLSACTARVAQDCGSTRCAPEQTCCTLCGGHQICMAECPPIDSCDDAGYDAGAAAGDAEVPDTDAGAPDEDAGVVEPVDAGGQDAGVSPGDDAGMDAGLSPGDDAGVDAGFDAGSDAGFDAGLCDVAETCDGTDEDCDGTIDEGGGCPCPLEHFGGHAYLLCPGALSWPQARDECEMVGYALVTVDDAAEDAFVFTEIDARAFDDTWIGANDRASEMDWIWVDGTPVTYEHWDSGEPNDGSSRGEDCGVIMTSPTSRESEWDDRACGVARPYVCEAPAP